MKYILFSNYDLDKKNPIIKEFKKRLKVDDEFVIDNITYKVMEKENKTLIIRMIRYKIDNTTTTIVHKCPAVENRIAKLDEYDFKKNKSRLKLRTSNIVNYCPTCGVIFYKDQKALPDPIQIHSLKDKVKLKKR